VIPQGEVDEIPNEILAINGVNGTMEKVNLMATGRRNRVEDTWPVEIKKWVKLQNEDTWCKEMKAKIGGSLKRRRKISQISSLEHHKRF
jgi:hypothetical protein